MKIRADGTVEDRGNGIADTGQEDDENGIGGSEAYKTGQQRVFGNSGYCRCTYQW